MVQIQENVYICFDEFMSDLFNMLMEVFIPEVFGALGIINSFHLNEFPFFDATAHLQ